MIPRSARGIRLATQGQLDLTPPECLDPITKGDHCEQHGPSPQQRGNACTIVDGEYRNGSGDNQRYSERGHASVD
jgi:hypothetical protein